jgi:hypothetical protein
LFFGGMEFIELDPGEFQMFNSIINVYKHGALYNKRHRFVSKNSNRKGKDDVLGSIVESAEDEEKGLSARIQLVSTSF